VDTSGQNLGLEGIIGQLRSRPARFTLLGTDWPIPAQAGIALIPLDPAPCCLWSLAYDPQHDWLPDVDLAELHRHP
jgi:hypothetical protein